MVQINQKRVLVVEDDLRLQEELKKPDFLPPCFEYRWAESYERAIEELDGFFPDIVLLDLCILDKQPVKDAESQPEPERKFGELVFDHIDRKNSKNQGIPIQVILATGNAKDSLVRKLIQDKDYVVTIVDKGIDNKEYKERVLAALEKANEQASFKPTLKYEIFDFPLRKELARKDKELYKLLNERVLRTYSRDDVHAAGTIIAARAFLKCLFKKLQKEKFDVYQQFKIQASIPDARTKEDWKSLVTMGVIERPHYLLADCLIEMRNHFKEVLEGKKGSQPTCYDAATALQLLVPIVKRYVDSAK